MMNGLTISASLSPYDIYLVSYWEWLAQQPVTFNTRRIYYSRVKQFVRFCEYANSGDRSQNRLSLLRETMPQYLEFLKASKRRGRMTINANINALNNFANFLNLEDPQLKREPCYAKPQMVLTPDEQCRFLRSVERQKSARDRALALVLFSTGLRIGDCARISGSDIVENASGITCISLGDGILLPLNELASFALKEWLIERQNNRLVKEDSGLWLTKRAKRLSISGIAFVIKRIGWQANLLVSAEMLRRTWLSATTVELSEQEITSRFGKWISAPTISKYASFP